MVFLKLCQRSKCKTNSTFSGCIAFERASSSFLEHHVFPRFFCAIGSLAKVKKTFFLFDNRVLCRGVIQLENQTYVLEPVPQSATNQHLLYLLADVQSGPATCGVVDEATAPSGSDHQPFEPGRSLNSLLRVCVPATVTGCVGCVCQTMSNVFSLLTEEAQFTADELCGAGAGCG